MAALRYQGFVAGLEDLTSRSMCPVADSRWVTLHFSQGDGESTFLRRADRDASAWSSEGRHHQGRVARYPGPITTRSSSRRRSLATQGLCDSRRHLGSTSRASSIPRGASSLPAGLTERHRIPQEISVIPAAGLLEPVEPTPWQWSYLRRGRTCRCPVRHVVAADRQSSTSISCRSSAGPIKTIKGRTSRCRCPQDNRVPGDGMRGGFEVSRPASAAVRDSQRAGKCNARLRLSLRRLWSRSRDAGRWRNAMRRKAARNAKAYRRRPS